MPLPKITIAIGVATLVIVGGFVVWSLSLGDTPSLGGNTSQSPSGYTSPSQTSVGAEGGGVAVVPDEKVPDFEKEYDEFFANMLATRARFSTVRSTTGVGGDLYALYDADVADARKAYPVAPAYDIEVLLVDLTDDGVQDALVYNTLPGACGSGGCVLDIYVREKGTWKKISSEMALGYVGISNTLTSGHLNLFLTVRTGIRYPDVVVQYVWNGQAYQAGEVVGYWDGSQLKAKR